MNGSSGTGVVRIAVDAMGGDHAPHEIVKGAVLAATEYPIEVLLVGQEEVVHEALDRIALAQGENSRCSQDVRPDAHQPRQLVLPQLATF